MQISMSHNCTKNKINGWLYNKRKLEHFIGSHIFLMIEDLALLIFKNVNHINIFESLKHKEIIYSNAFSMYLANEQ